MSILTKTIRSFASVFNSIGKPKDLTKPSATSLQETQPKALMFNPLKLSGQALRDYLAKTYLAGEGIEIGALHNPLPVPENARVKYVDRLSAADLRKHYPELASYNLVEPDIIEDGELLTSISEASQDFVISSHLLEHCQNPLSAFSQWFRVLKPGGIMYLAVPDMRFTFDKNREPTSADHILRDYREGPEWSEYQHYKDWVIQNDPANPELEVQANHLRQQRYSIHFHAWGQLEILEFMVLLQKELNLHFDVLAFFQNEIEVIFILKKLGVSPHLI